MNRLFHHSSQNSGNMLYRVVSFGFFPILFFLLIFIPPLYATESEKLNCEMIFPPATGVSFPFSWRTNRCEGLIKGDTGNQRQSVKISYFGFGRLDGAGPFEITNTSNQKIELLGSLLSRYTFYRLVAHLLPNETINWQYPDELTDIFGKSPDKISFMATNINAGRKTNQPFTISGSQDIHIGIVSSDFRFNFAAVSLFNNKNELLCDLKHDFKRRINRRQQAIFSLAACEQYFKDTARLAVTAVHKLNEETPPKFSNTASLWME